MRIFKTRSFARWARRKVSDRRLCGVVTEMESGLTGDPLGGGVFKKRVALPGRGKRGGARVVLAYRSGDRIVFMVGYGKNERATVSPAELVFIEVDYDDKEQNS